jgi:hypothetical protein
MVGAYRTRDVSSYSTVLTASDGTRFFATIDEARKVLPNEARQQPFQPEDQFLELWEVLEPTM